MISEQIIVGGGLVEVIVQSVSGKLLGVDSIDEEVTDRSEAK